MGIQNNLSFLNPWLRKLKDSTIVVSTQLLCMTGIFSSLGPELDLLVNELLSHNLKRILFFPNYTYLN